MAREDDSQLLYWWPLLCPGFEVSSVGGNISVCSVEMSQRHVSRLSTHKLKYA